MLSIGELVPFADSSAATGAVSVAGSVNTSGTSVTLVSGSPFQPWPYGTPITINGTSYLIASVTNGTSLTLTTSAGTQSSVGYSVIFPAPLIDNPAATVNLTGQTANIGVSILFTPPSGAQGMYRANCYVVATSGVSSTAAIPSCQVQWQDFDTNTGQTRTLTSATTASSVGTNTNGVGVFYSVGNGTNTINYTTSGYAAGTSSLNYALHIKLDYLGP
jgi:hypothetical protein